MRLSEKTNESIFLVNMIWKSGRCLFFKKKMDKVKVPKGITCISRLFWIISEKKKITSPFSETFYIFSSVIADVSTTFGLIQSNKTLTPDVFHGIRDSEFCLFEEKYKKDVKREKWCNFKVGSSICSIFMNLKNFK